MPKFSVDLNKVANIMANRSFKLSDVKDKIEKIAFDIFKFKGASADELWQLQDTDEGTYLVALYEDDEEKVATASIKSSWNVVVKDKSLHFFYKNDYLCCVAATDLGFQDKDLELACKYLPEKLVSNKSLSQQLLNSIEEPTRKAIAKKHPELA